MDQEKIIEDIDKLISLGLEAAKNRYEAGFDYWSYMDYYSGFRSATLSYLKRLLGESDTFYVEFNLTLSNNKVQNVSGGISILRSLKSSITNNWLFDLKYLVSAEIFADFMEMSKYLLDEGYKDASAVMLGSILEEHLRNLASKNNIPIIFKGNNGVEKPKKADTLNSDLTKKNIYSKLEQKQITAWLDLRNNAAHGHYSEYDVNQVKTMFQGLIDFMIRVK